MRIPFEPWAEAKPRWVACIDLLGFSNKVCESDLGTLYSIYNAAVKELKDWSGRFLRVKLKWFSDTFILYTHDNSPNAFIQIEMFTRFFVNALILRRIPFRGALSCGDLIVDEENGVFVGSALVDAYRLCEGQDWIGFSLSPTTVQRMGEIGIRPGKMLHYRSWPIPRKPGNSQNENLFALVLGGPTEERDQNWCYKTLVEMRSLLDEGPVKAKYDRTIEFIERAGTIRKISTVT